MRTHTITPHTYYYTTSVLFSLSYEQQTLRSHAYAWARWLAWCSLAGTRVGVRAQAFGRLSIECARQLGARACLLFAGPYCASIIWRDPTRFGGALGVRMSFGVYRYGLCVCNVHILIRATLEWIRIGRGVHIIRNYMLNLENIKNYSKCINNI